MKTIYLTQGKKTLVDDADWEYLHSWEWTALRGQSGYYAVRSTYPQGKRVLVHMSRVILGLTDPKVLADHRSGDTLDNRRDNLRPATKAQNRANAVLNKNSTSKLRGVTYLKSQKRWRARIRLDGKDLFLGYFDSKEEAEIVYHQKAVEVWGEFVK